MAVQTIHTINHPGVDISAGAVAADVAGDSWANSGNQMAAIINGGIGSVTVTLPYQIQFDGGTPTNKTLAIPAGHTAIVGPFSPAYYNDTNGRANITYSGVSSVSIYVFQPGS